MGDSHDTQGARTKDNKSGAPGLPIEILVSLLAYAAGAMDVFSFLKFHQVFTSAMTGNTALLGLGLGQGHFRAASYSFTALAGFALGNITATFTDETNADRPTWRRLLAVELSGLALVAVLWGLFAHPLHEAQLYALIMLSAGSMGVQSVIARKINLPGITTVVFTTTLTLIMMGVTSIVMGRADAKERVNARRQSVMMLVYLLGAAVSGVFAAILPRLIAVPPFIAVALALIIPNTTQHKRNT
jgi:uncharacterized membrane protein YoaK (UPF0700 family)